MKSTLAFCLLLPALALALRDSRIVGGSNSNIANHPWQASLRINGNHACGAVLYSNTRALTAAHCGGGSTSTYSILAGTTDRTTQTCATCAMRNPILAIARHPGFINNPSAGYPSDVATVWFHSIADNANIKYADLAQLADGDFLGANCVVSGWGREAAGGDLPTTLQSGSMTVISNQQCIDTWGSNRIRPDQICAQSASVSVCGGDQGGPLTCGGKLVGVYSWNEANCGVNFPSVFIRVSEYYEWINENSVQPEVDPEYSVDEMMAALFD